MKNEFEFGDGVSDPDAPTAKEMNEVKRWIEEVQAAEKREHKWRQSGHEVVKLYEADHKVSYQFNILYSNTETLAPALYSTTPTTIVQRRFKDDDPVGFEASKVVQRALEYALDDGQAIYASFDNLMTSAVQSALVPGRGVVRFKYDVEIVNEAPVEPEDKEDIQDRPETLLPGTAESEVSSGAQVKWESVCGETIPWDRFTHGYGRSWQEVPWIAYKWPMTREDLIKNFGYEIGSKVIVSSVSDKELDNEKDQSQDMMKGMKIAWVSEIWNKATREVIFVSEGYKDAPLRKVPDPLQLTGFFNCPEPLSYFTRISSLLPQTLYAFYEEQAKELNQVTARINRLIKACKVRGIYDGSIQELSRLFSEDDNALLPAENVTAMYDRGGIEKAIWMVPIDKIMQVLSQLYITRQQCKQVIYEVTGLSDILRGTSNPNETLGAQKIKDQWGNLRLRKLQKRTQSYVVDSLRIMAEIACSKFSLETFQQMTNLKYPMQEEKQAAQAQLLQQMQIAQQTGQPPAPPPEDIQTLLATPSWQEILGVLQNDLQRSYKIDIETNSTIEPEATEDKESMMGLMNALSQFLLGVQPLVADGSLPFEAMKSILLTITKRFNFGSQVEDELKKMQPPQPKANPEAEKQQADLAKQAQDIESQKAQLETDKQKAALQLQFDQKVAEMQKQLDAAQADFAQAKLTNDMEATKQAFEAELKLQQTIFDLKLEAKDELARIDRENDTRVHELKSQVNSSMDAVNRKSEADSAASKLKSEE